MTEYNDPTRSDSSRADVPSSVSLEDSEWVWNELGEVLDAFSAAWNAAPPEPKIGDFLPDTPRTLRGLALVELIKADLEIRLPTRSAPELRSARLADLRRQCHHNAVNPARELARRFRATDINPATDETRGSVGEQAEKLRLLDELSRHLG